MSSNPPSSSRFQAIFNTALKEYSQKTGKDIVTDSITAKLRCCSSPDAVLDVLQEEAQAFNDFRNGNRKVQLMRKLKPTIDILLMLSTSEVLGNSIGSTFPHASAILAGIGLLLAAAKGVSTSYDSLIDLFECFENYLGRLRIFSEIPPAMEGILVKIMVELLGVLALATQQIKQGRLKKFAKKLLGENDVEAVLKRLDRLTMEESRMTVAQTMEVVHGLFANMTEVMDDGKTSTNNIREALVAIQEIAEGVNEIKRGELQNTIRRWLSPPNPSINHNTASEVHHKVSATWFTSGTVYRGWKALGSLLWVHGKPGSGKTVFCSSIIKDLEDERKAGLASLAYYYFDFKDSQKQDRRGFLSSLLLQLSARSDVFSKILTQIHLTHDKGSRQPSESDLIDCLNEMLAVHGQGKIYIILDALDECPNNSGMPTSREKVLNLLKDLISLRLPHVHICVTSRPEVDIQTALEHLAPRRVSLHEEGGQRQDIIDYLKSVVESDPRMGKWREEDKQLVIDTLARKADGMFRWVFCQLDTLRRCFPGSIRRALNEIPKTLDETYERILLGIDEEKWEYAHRLFQCLTVSRRPLLVEELAEVLALDLDIGAIPKLNVNLRPKDAKEAVLSACSTLISIIKPYSREIVQFSHYSVKEFLTSNRLESSTRRPILSRFYISPLSAHVVLAQSCISTLLLPGWDYSDFDDFPLVEYAAVNWVDHAQVHGVASHIQIGMESLFDPERPHFERWYDFQRELLYYDAPPFGRLPLTCATLYGFDHLVKHLVITRQLDPNAPDPENFSPLEVAIQEGNHAIAKFLLERGADPNYRNWENRTLLHEAAIDGDLDVAQLLLNGGADTRALDDLGDSPLHAALEFENLNVLQLLLEQGADVNIRDVRDSTPLHKAFEIGSIDAVKLLLNYCVDTRALDDRGASLIHMALGYDLNVLQLLLEGGADVNARDYEGSTPLHEMSQWGSIDAVKLLLNYGADMRARDDQGASPLHMASGYDTLDVLRLLLEQGADVNSRDERDCTPLHYALECESIDAVKLLLNYGADTRALNDQGASPLHMASGRRTLNILQLLLEQGADVNTRDDSDSTPLHKASESGSIDAVKLLLNYGADTRALNDQGASPLHTALGYGNLNVLQLLLEQGADVNTRDDRDSTPLHKASESGSIDAVKLLVNYGADTRALDDRGASPLHTALEYGNLDVLQLLLEQGADVNTRDDRDSTPLHKASECGSIDAVKLLLNNGADIMVGDNQKVSPLHEASRYGNVQIVRLLLQCRADVNTRDGQASTPLHRASTHGHLDVVRQLLDFGANIMVSDSQGASPLHVASLFGHAHVVQQLLQYRADVNTRDDKGSTPLHHASRSGHVEIVEELLRWGAHVDAGDHDYKTALCEASLHGHTRVVESLLERGTDVNAGKSGYQTSLHVAVEKRNFDLTWLLLAYGADPNARDEGGWTPLHFAATCGHLQIVNLLLDRGANVHSQEEHRRTPLHLAALSGDGDTAHWLIKHGANLHSRDDVGRTPFSVALETGNRKVARLLSDWESS